MYMEAETDAGGVSIWPGVGAVFAREMGVREGRGACRSAREVRILLYEAPQAYALPPRRLLPSHLHSVCRLALREGVRHVVHLPPPEGLLGYPLGEVVRLSATLLMLAGAAQRDACDGVCACAPALQGRACGW